MANIALDQICESMSSTQQGVFDAEAGMTRAAVSGTASFVVGASAGVALQVQAASKLPSKIKGLMLVPLTLGTLAGTVVYNHYATKCEEEWKNGRPQLYRFRGSEMNLHQHYAN